MTNWIAENWTLFELLCWGGVVGFFVLFPSTLTRIGVSVRRVIAPLTARPLLAVLIPGLVPVALRLALFLTGAQSIPEPNVADEFSYLLGAETFAEGRLANPPSPFWEHFEVPFVVHQPSYASMYPPGQALCLAAGQKLFGHPWFGVLISVGFFGAALAWMLRGWMPANWAFIGALLLGLRLSGFGYWSGSYWGGALAAGAGALVLGAWPRLTGMRVGSSASLRIRDSLLLGIGVALLANTRPFEGAALCAPLAFVLLFALRRHSVADRLRLVLPAALVLAATALGMGIYFEAVTGSATRMPYALHGSTYGVQPNFVWQAPRPSVTYENPLLSGVFGIWEERYLHTRTLTGWLAATRAKLGYVAGFFVGPLLVGALLGLPGLLASKRGRRVFALSIWFFAALACEVSFFPHYAAPASALFVLILLECMRRLRVWGRTRGEQGQAFTKRVALALAAAPLVALGLAVFGRAMVATEDLPVRFWAHPFDPWSQRATPLHARHVAAQPLLDAGGKHLVFLRYTADEHHRKWAYNGADLVNATILWAWERGGEADRHLVDSHPDRRVWLAWPDLTPPRIEPFGE